MTTLLHFEPIYADSWMAASEIDDWEAVNPMECYQFKNGMVQLSKQGYWFPYQGHYTTESLFVNLVKPHVLK